MNDLLIKAASFAEEAHKGQTRRDGLTLYIHHPRVVAGRVRDESVETQMTAWLHDVLEDTDKTENDMRSAGIPKIVIETVKILTKTPGEDYSAYLARVKSNEIARKVKIADMLANLADNPTEKQIVKYAHGLLELLS